MNILIIADRESDNRSVQENFDLITSFIQESADIKHIPSKTSLVWFDVVLRPFDTF